MLRDLLSRFPVREHPTDLWVEKADAKPRLIDRLWVQGSDLAFVLLQRLPETGLAIVGTRTPRERTLDHVRRVVAQLRGQRRLVILSGFARGVDACAHTAALEADLPTIAFIAGGHDVDYPPQHASLRKKILERDGLIISEYEPGTSPIAGRFLDRNAVLVAHSHAVWIAEAPLHSGAMNTAAHARRMGRTLFATPAFPTDTAYLGNLKLLHQEHVGIPLLDARSLGSAWLELSTTPSILSASAEHRADVSNECRVLVGMVKELILKQQSAGLDRLLSRWADRNLPHERFFPALKEALIAQALKASPNGFKLND